MKKTYNGTDGTIGFVSAWESKVENVGVGEQEILKITEGERIDMKLRFKVPFEAEDDAYMTTQDVENNQTKVKWGFKGAFPYPMNLMGLYMDMDKEVGGDLEVGLKNLKTVLENKNYEIRSIFYKSCCKRHSSIQSILRKIRLCL